MAVCEGCGTDHDKDLLENVENYTHLQNAWNALGEEADKNAEGGSSSFVPTHIQRFMRRQNLAHQQALMQFVMEDGPHKGPDKYIEMMMEVTFCLGVMVADRYKMPYYTVTPEELEATRQDFLKMVEAAHNAPDPDDIAGLVRRALEEKGIDPNSIQIMEVDGVGPVVTKKSASEDESPTPGLYL